MNETKYLHLAALTRDFVLHLQGLGYSEHQLLGGTGVTLADITPSEARAPLTVSAEVMRRAVALTGDDLIHFKWAQVRQFKRLGLIGYLGRSAPTLRDFLENIARYQRTFSDAVNVDVSDLDRHGFFRWDARLPAKVDSGYVMEAQAVQFVSGIRNILKRSPRILEVTFCHHRATNQDAFTSFLNCPVRFDAPHNELRLYKADLDLELQTADNALYAILRNHCDMVLAQTPQNRDDIRLRVEKSIVDRLSSGQANIETVSHDLGMSSRTLARRLADVETTYQKVLSNLRKSLAERYLKDVAMSQTEIAFLLGYSDVSSFSSAFKRWTGHAPGDQRRPV
ncbi:AraC family transcriptional regulator [Shimia sp. Alg240-R146]|uniref:AraC family transcriptional regulator n=1 Tax=Shimia sp. Alg240-R146 TaxID=2993449 RepID=UPI0022E53522|nr:AraC family transcriptional regulator [Shimia sp. Alg240-R146]